MIKKIITKDKKTIKIKLKTFWDKIPKSLKGIIDGILFGLIIFLIILLFSLSPIWPKNIVVPWFYIFIILILLAIIFELVEQRLTRRKARLQTEPKKKKRKK